MSGSNIGLLGVGAWGRNHARVLLELGLLRRAFDPESARLAEIPGSFRAASWREVIDDPAVSAVVIATPARMHHDLARAALAAGKDVLVEKPLTLDATEGEGLVQAARERGAILMVGHVTLYHPAIIRLLELVREGRLGRLRYLYANRLNLGTVRETEDILWSFAPHDIAVFLELLGSWPLSVTAHGGSYLAENRADVTVTHLDFEGGVRGHIFVSWLHPWKEHRLVVIGDRRMATFVDGDDGGELRIFEAGAAPGEALNVAARGKGTLVEFEKREPLRAELEHFAACVRTRTEPRTGGDHGVRVLRILETARLSLDAGSKAMVPAANTRSGR